MESGASGPSQYRKFLDVLERSEDANNNNTFLSTGDDTNTPDARKEALLQFVRNSIIGEDIVFKGPFGYRKITYCDYTASGRALTFVEDFIRAEVLPLYANTHTSTTATALQTSLYRFEARELIKRAVNGHRKNDILLFTGTGSTGAIQKMVHVLGLHPIPAGSNETRTDKVVVFVGPYEHHSNLLPWREARAKVVQINEDTNGEIDIVQLEQELKNHSSYALKIGSFSAASNITGQLSDTTSISILLHKYGALAFWDFATAGPHVKIDVNPIIDGPDSQLAYMDAVFISPHKFVGGVGTPGILVAKKVLFTNPVPTVPGGGTVFFVTGKDHRYVKNIEEREEGGTPDIIGSIRCGLIFQLKNAIGERTICERETEMFVSALNIWKSNPNLFILGNYEVFLREYASKKGQQRPHHIAIFSFMVRHPGTGKFLHHNFVSSLLNDLFGISSRGGCSCAGPYAQSLLGIDYDVAKKFEAQLVEKDFNEFLRPGFVRLNLNYFVDKPTFDFVVRAVDFVAREGWKLLPEYKFVPDTGEWKHHTRSANSLLFDESGSRKWIGEISYRDGQMRYKNKLSDMPKIQMEPENLQELFNEYLDDAQRYVQQTIQRYQAAPKSKLVDQKLLLSQEAEDLRWFLYPSEAEAEILAEVTKKEDKQPPKPCPINPKLYGDRILPSVTTESGERVEDGGAGVANKDSGNNDNAPLSKKAAKRQLFPKVPKSLTSRVGQAIKDFDMIRDGDRVLLGLSGGKDSLTLLHILAALQKRAPIRFDLAACTVDPETPSFDPSSLKVYMKQLGIPYFYESDSIVDNADRVCPSSICSYCSRMKRGILYNCARREGYNVLALAQHLDDLAESFIMSAFHNGALRTMKAHYVIDTGDLRVIRPLVYIRERETKAFARQHKLPIISENCPACFEIPKERHRVKTLLASQETLFPKLYPSLLAALRPLMETDMEKMLEVVHTYGKLSIDEMLKAPPKKPQPSLYRRRNDQPIDNNNNHNNSNNINKGVTAPANPEEPAKVVTVASSTITATATTTTSTTAFDALAKFSTEDLIKELERRKAAAADSNHQQNN